MQRGAVDGAILTVPQNCYAEGAGFTNLGWTVEYAKELPFSGGAVNRAWAAANKPVLDRFIVAYNKSVNWFQDRNNRAAAVKIMMEAGRQKQEDVQKNHDLLPIAHFYSLHVKITTDSHTN